MGELLRMPSRPDDRTTGRAIDRAGDRPEPLWRELTGSVLRRYRHERRERLADVAERAGVSTQYLSEVERGRKDASSELLAAVAGALDLTLRDLSLEVARDLGSRRIDAGRPRGPLALAA